MAEGGDSRPPSADPLDVEGGTANLESTKGSGRPLLRSISAFTQRQFSRPVTQRQYSTASTTVSRPPTAPTSRSFQFRFPKTPRSRKHSTYSSVSNTSRYNTRMSFQFGYPKTPRSRKYSTYSTVSNASRKFAEGTKSFFGIGEDCTHTQKRWSQRRVRHASRRYGKIKEESIQRILEPDPAAIPLPQIVDPLALPHRQRMVPAPYDDIDGATDYTTPTTPGAWSSASSLWRRAAFGALTQQRQKVQRQQSVVSMGWDLLVKMTLQQKREQDVAKPAPLVNSRSFAPVSMEEDDDIDDLDFSFFGRDLSPSHKEDMYDDEVFFDASPTPQGTLQYDAVQPGRAGMAANVFDMVDGGAAPAEYEIRAGDALDREEREANARMLPTDRGWRTGSKKRIAPPLRGQDVMAARAPRRRNRIGDRVLQMALDNSDRREYGRGLVGKWLKRSYRSSMAMSSDIKHQLDTITDYRPYFTYWVTFVHILITIIALAVYGIAPIGFAETETTALVRTPKLSLENIPKIEKDNFWIGPKDEDLIHLGAKYSPCMRKDPKIIQRIEDQRRKENQTGCCIKTDQSGCYQSVEDDCSKTFAEFWRWSEDNPGPHGRISGAVCGQDPEACKNPVSVAPHEWPDDMTKWPVCKEPVAGSSGGSQDHMACEVTAHPCCIGITGTCEITTREYCEFKHGFFHQEASLCSQVSCMDRICGLLPFMDPEVPDQFYRLWTSLFLHAGLVHLLLSVIFQMTILRDLEKLAGWGRIAIIYILSGIGGNLASAVFLPYQAEVGPAGAHFGVIACLFVEVFQSWQMLQAPWRAILKLSIIVLVLFLLGLLPWIDNFAHITGFICGILLSFSFLPYITFGAFDKNRKRIQIIVSFLLFVAFFSGLVVLFYVRPLTDCQGCEYVNCIPFDKTFCKYQGLDLTPRDETT
ncbi:inactive rhomboid protein 1-like isoform X2 [Branchiostoma floridae]|uniref:Inactive rhomboid protein 1-like isoform X2 n=1 Tax=Branchiostoma floridae TaxID=7739 RepID=A0A9J7M8X7_BRAFL|nr:inactive rhomboid protein 1-like isoform X2 [Branchiostoma floridae]